MKTLVLADNLRDSWNFMDGRLCVFVSCVDVSSGGNSIMLEKKKKKFKKTGNFSRLAINNCGDSG